MGSIQRVKAPQSTKHGKSMKSSILISLALLGAGTAIAQDAGKKPGERKPFGSRPSGDGEGRGFVEFLKRADTDGDGKVSEQEFMTLERLSKLSEDQRRAMFARLDKNGDGFVEAREMKFSGRPGGGKDGMPRLGELDLDKNGSVSFDEFLKSEFVKRLPEERRRAFFDRLDRNGDGVLSPADRMGGGRERGPGGPGGPGRGPGEGRSDAKPKFESVDKNGDGVVDFEEFQNIPGLRDRGEDLQEDLFEKADQNGDLKLQAEEFDSVQRGPEGDGARGKGGPGKGRRDGQGGRPPMDGKGKGPQGRQPATPDA